MSGACVTDSFARAKEAWSGSIRSPYPDGGASSGSYPPVVKSASWPRPLSIPDRKSTQLAAFIEKQLPDPFAGGGCIFPRNRDVEAAWDAFKAFQGVDEHRRGADRHCKSDGS